jgi:hypothetical protein
MKFDFGDKVVTQCGEIGAIVGITTVETPAQAETLWAAIGEVVYIVEIGDGSDLLCREVELVAFRGPLRS